MSASTLRHFVCCLRRHLRRLFFCLCAAFCIYGRCGLEMAMLRLRNCVQYRTEAQKKQKKSKRKLCSHNFIAMHAMRVCEEEKCQSAHKKKARKQNIFYLLYFNSSPFFLLLLFLSHLMHDFTFKTYCNRAFHSRELNPIEIIIILSARRFYILFSFNRMKTIRSSRRI